MQNTIWILMKDEQERRTGEYGRDEWSRTIIAMEAYTDMEEALRVRREGQEDFDVSKKNGCEPDYWIRYYVSEVEIVK